MSDTLVELSANPWFRQAIKSLGLPLPTPQKLRRPRGARTERPLEDRRVVVGLPTGAELGDVLADSLPRAGAFPLLAGPEQPPARWIEMGEAYGRPPALHSADESADDGSVDALVLDATGVDSPEALRGLYDFFHPRLRRLGRGGRVLVIGRPAELRTTVAAAAASAALEGFARALAKELGRSGSTAHVVFVAPGAEGHLDPLLRFLLSERSAFLTGQPWSLSAAIPATSTGPRACPLEGQRVLVTGAARGIGAATVATLAAEGAHVLCLDRPGDEGPLSQVARDAQGTPLAIDLTAPDAPIAIADAIRERVGTIHGVIHNAGITRDKTLARMKPEHWDQAVAVNLGAVVSVTAALLEGVLEDNGRVVCLSSVSGIAGNVGQTNYSASKAGVVGYVRALATALAPRGISVTAVAPGFIETRLTQAMPVVPREVGRRLSALGQGGEPRDVAELLTFLSLSESAGLTGQVTRACGGMFIGA